MKKVFIFLMLILLCGCSINKEKSILNEIDKKVSSSKAYHISGTLEIYRNEEKYTYNVDSSYMDKDYYKVDLINTNNNHEQVIIKNKEGVYVITPSLNKSFKFQSDWPYNNSQIYLLQPIIQDLKSDKQLKIEKTKKENILSSKVNYTSERSFVKQKIYLDKDNNITKIEVLDADDNVKMKLKILEIDYKARYDEDYFDASKYDKLDHQEKQSKKETVSKITDITYPMYLPVDTTLSGQDVVETEGGERVILTFSGETPFTVIQETYNNDELTDYVYGDPYLILDTVGSITDYSVSWISNGIEYSVMSDTMDIDELIEVAQSISVKAVGK